MKYFLTLNMVFLLSLNANASFKIIYGTDNRQDVYQVNNALHKKISLSSAAMIHAGHFSKSSAKGYYDLIGVPSLKADENVCKTEKFANQPVAASCSGFLVAPDILVTAGHCYIPVDDPEFPKDPMNTPENNCKAFAWVFGYEMTSPLSDPNTDIPLDHVYACSEVIAAELSDERDFAIIKLDRPVVDREGLAFRENGKVPNGTILGVVGHPSGLPTKIATSGKITRNSQPNSFSTTLDTFQGNSGSAVFDAETGKVEGILIQGRNDYGPSKRNDPTSCQIVNKCDENVNNCTFSLEDGKTRWGEVVLRIDVIAQEIRKAMKKSSQHH